MKWFQLFKNPALQVLAFLALQKSVGNSATLYLDQSAAENGFGPHSASEAWEAESAIWTAEAHGVAGSNTSFVMGSDLVFGVTPEFEGAISVVPQSAQTVGSLQFLGTSVTLGDHSFANGGAVPVMTIAGSGRLAVENQDSIIKSRLSASVDLEKTGLGKLTLDHGAYGTGGYFNISGRTFTVRQGTLEVAGATSSDAMAVARFEVESGAVLRVTGQNVVHNAAVFNLKDGARMSYHQHDAIGNFSGSGWMAVNSALNIDLGTDQVFSGNLEGASALNVRSGNNAAGSLTLAGANSYRGTITFNPEAGKLNHGNLILGHRRALQMATLNMDNASEVYGENGLRFASGVGEFLVGNLIANQRDGVSSNLILRDDEGLGVTLWVGNTNQNGRFTGQISGEGSLGKVGIGTLTLDRTNTYTGDTIIATGSNHPFASNGINTSTLALDFTAPGAPLSQIISENSRLVLQGGHLQMLGAASEGSYQFFNHTHLSGAVSRVTLTQHSSGAESTLGLGQITREVGGQVLFTLPTGTQSLTHGILTTSTNTHGILGAWARIGGDWARGVSSGLHSNVMAFADYELPAGSVLNSSPTAHLKIGSATTQENLTLHDTETVFQTLMFEHSSARSIQFESSQTLRLAGGGLWFKSVGGTQHQMGLANQVSVGALTAGETSGIDAELTVIVDATARIHTKIVDNGAGKLTLVKAGVSDLHLLGANTFTGGLIVTQGRVNQLHTNALGANVASNFIKILAGGQVFFNSSTSNHDVYLAGNGWGETAVPGAIRLSGTSLNGTITLTGNAVVGTHGGNNLTNNHLRGKITGDYQLGFAAGGSAVGTSGGTFNIYNTGNDYRGGLTLNGIEGHTGAIMDRVLILKSGASEVVPHGLGYGDVLIHGGTGSLSTLDLNGYSETINGLQSGVNASNAIVTNHHASAASELKVGAHHGFASFAGILRDGSNNAKLALTKLGSGTQDLSGANTYSGDTRIEDGSLRATAANTFSTNSKVWLANKSTAILDLNGYSQTIRDLSGGGYVNFGTTAGSSTATVLQVNQQADSVYEGQIVGTGTLHKEGSGRLSLSGQNSYLGETRVSAGNLQVGVAGVGTTGSGKVLVTNTAVLSGSGRVFGRTTLASGTVLRPGDAGGASTGTLKFDTLGDSLTLDSGSKAELQIGGAGNHDRLEISGNLVLGDTSQFEVSLTSGYQGNLGDSFDLVDWGMVSGDLIRDGFNVATALTIETSTFMTLQGWSWAKDQFLTSGVVYVIPEPSRALLQLGALSLLFLRRKRSGLK